MSRSVGFVVVLVLSFVLFVFGQVLAGTPFNDKKNVAPTEGLAKAFKAADQLAALEKGSSKHTGITSSKKNKSASKYSGKKSASKKSAYSKVKNSKKHSSIKSKYSKKPVSTKNRSHKHDRKTKTAKRF
jgi:hypothetical protein